VGELVPRPCFVALLSFCCLITARGAPAAASPGAPAAAGPGAPAAARPTRPDAGQTPPPAHNDLLSLPDAGERSLDPIGLDDSTGRELDRAAARLDEARRRAQQVVKTQTAVHGEVLTSIDAVSEVAHRVQVSLAQGLAFVEVELVFASRSATPAELAYRLPLPPDAALYAFRACRLPPEKGVAKNSKSPRCLDAVPAAASSAESAHGGPSESPAASARTIYDARGAAIALRAAALDKSALLSLRVAYVAAAPLHGGVVRFRLPARGYDPRLAPSEITLQAKGFEPVEPIGPRTLDAHLPLDLRAELSKAPAPKPLTTQALCGGKPCTRRYEAAPSAPARARPSWLLLDTSPSMEGPARNAADLTLASLLSLLPEASPLRVFAFAARTQELGRYTPDAAPLKRLSDALMSDLGAATQPARVLEAHKAELFSERPRVLLLSDGKLDRAALAALASFEKRGIELWLIALAPSETAVAGHFSGVVLAAGSEGDALDERLRAALAPATQSGLRAGEERVQESAPKKRYTPRPSEGWLSFWLARHEPALFATEASAPAGFIVAPPFESVAAKAVQPDTGMPKESVLSMLRSQLIPEARACLRSDRKGRADYAVSLTFHALFAGREAYDVRIEGRLPDKLRSCLADVVDRLRIPAFSGRIRVRYPIHTEREPEAPVIELEGEALEEVNRVISGK
jgi:hypothetical protein